VDALARVSPARGGGAGVARPLAGGPWNLAIELVPARTAAEIPPRPAAPPEEPAPESVPARAFSAFRDIVPVGQARLAGGAAVCLWALERYAERAVLTATVLGAADDEIPPLSRDRGHVVAWDDHGGAYAVTPLGGVSGPGWSETVLELVPAIDPRARALGVRLEDVPGGRDGVLEGPFAFGLALTPPAWARRRGRRGLSGSSSRPTTRPTTSARSSAPCSACSTRRGSTGACWWWTTRRRTGPPRSRWSWSAPTVASACCGGR